MIYRTHSAGLNHSLVVVEYAVQLTEAGVDISHAIFSQNVTLTQATTVLLINKALIAAQRGAKQQGNAHKPQS